MGWFVEFNDSALKQLKKLDRRWQSAILDYLEDRVAASGNPRQFGKPLSGDLKGWWRYRVGDYRIICDVQEQRLVVLVVKIGHRGDVYR